MRVGLGGGEGCPPFSTGLGMGAAAIEWAFAGRRRCWDPDVNVRLTLLQCPQTISLQKSGNGQTANSCLCFLPLDQYLPSPRPSGRSLVIIGPGPVARANGFSGS